MALLTLTADLTALLPTWPVLYIIHAMVTAIALRSEPGGFRFAVNHPVASCVMNMIVASSGSLLMNLMLGRPLVQGVVSEEKALVSVLAWFLVYFSPGDMVYSLCTTTHVKVVFAVSEELRRSRNIMVGVVAAATVYPTSLVCQALAGMFKGTGKKWGITLFRAVSGSHLTGNLELLNLSLLSAVSNVCYRTSLTLLLSPCSITKGGFLLGFLFALTNHLSLSLRQEECILLGAAFLTTVKFWDMARNDSHDPLRVPQQALWKIINRSVVDNDPADSSTKEQRQDHDKPRSPELVSEGENTNKHKQE